MFICRVKIFKTIQKILLKNIGEISFQKIIQIFWQNIKISFEKQ